MTTGAKRSLRHAAAFLLTSLTLLTAAPADAASVLRRGNQAEPSTLDIHLAGSAWEYNILGDLFLGLTTEDVNAEPIAGAAESWTTSPDGLIWTFKLRDGLVWSDGEPLRASDFVLSFQRLLDPKTAAQYASLHYIIKNAQAVNAGKLPVADIGVRAPDERTVEITLESPTPYLLGLLTHWTAYPIPAHIYRKFGSDWVKPGNMVSNGPYTLVHWKANDEIKLLKNPRFYDAANVAIDEVLYYPTDDQVAALNRFRAGELDANIGTRGFPISQLPWLQENMPGVARISPQLGNEYIALNIRRAPFSDGRLRRAVSLCLDRRVLTEKVTRDGQIPAYAFVPPGTDNYKNDAKLDFSEHGMDARRAEAKKLLADAGYPDGKGFPAVELLYNTSEGHKKIAEALQEMWKKNLGIDVKLFNQEWKVYLATMEALNYGFARAGWIGDYNDPMTFLDMFVKDGGNNQTGWTNPKYDEIVGKVRKENDPAKRIAMFEQLEEMLMEELPVIPIYTYTRVYLKDPQVAGWYPNIMDYHPLKFVSIK